MSDTPDTCRAEFEAWIKEFDGSLAGLIRDGDGYEDFDTQRSWAGWQAAWNRRTETAEIAALRQRLNVLTEASEVALDQLIAYAECEAKRKHIEFCEEHHDVIVIVRAALAAQGEQG